MNLLLEKLLTRLRSTAVTHAKLDRHIDEIKIAQALILLEGHRRQTSKSLQDYELKVFSQWGEDGIIQKLIRSVEIKNPTFIEFGVEDFIESNCRFILMNNNWSGFVIDGSSRHVRNLQSSYFYWKYHLTAVDQFITRENINELLLQSGFDSDIGILSVDLDGVDYHVLESITAYRPRILIAEYNSVFGSTRPITVPYSPKFRRGMAHASHLYFGASLSALEYLAKKKGYALVGTNKAGVNAFFVREDLVTDELEVITAERAYTLSKFRESRDPTGRLSYLNDSDRLRALEGMPVLNVISGQVETL